MSANWFPAQFQDSALFLPLQSFWAKLTKRNLVFEHFFWKATRKKKCFFTFTFPKSSCKNNFRRSEHKNKRQSSIYTVWVVFLIVFSKVFSDPLRHAFLSSCLLCFPAKTLESARTAAGLLRSSPLFSSAQSSPPPPAAPGLPPTQLFFSTQAKNCHECFLSTHFSVPKRNCRSTNTYLHGILKTNDLRGQTKLLSNS